MEHQKNNFLYNYWQYLFLFAFVFSLYGNTLKNKYALDDEYVVENNLKIKKGLNGIPEIFTSRYSTNKVKTFGYRPIVLTTFAIEYELFGENTTINHFFNVFLYFLISIVLLKLLLRFFNNFSPYFILAILVLFLAHPTHTEVVASLKNRDELLSYLFALLSLHYTIKYADTNKLLNLIFALFLFAIAYLSKQSAVAFILLIPLSVYFFTDTKYWKIIVVFILLFILWKLSDGFPRTFLGKSDRLNEFFENPLFANDTFYQRILTAIYSLFFYIKLVIFPKDLSFYYGYNTLPVESLFSIKSIISIIVHSFLFIYAILKFPKKDPISFGILFYLISISIFINLVKPVMGIVADRYLFSAVFGFSIAIVFVVFKNTTALTKLSMIYNHVGKVDEAINVNVKFIEKNALIEEPYLNLANLYYINKDTAKAVIFAEKALKINPQNVNTLKVLYNYYFSKGNSAKANYYLKMMP